MSGATTLSAKNAELVNQLCDADFSPSSAERRTLKTLFTGGHLCPEHGNTYLTVNLGLSIEDAHILTYDESITGAEIRDDDDDAILVEFGK
jgi:hypothetical protein